MNLGKWVVLRTAWGDWRALNDSQRRWADFDSWRAAYSYAYGMSLVSNPVRPNTGDDQ